MKRMLSVLLLSATGFALACAAGCVTARPPIRHLPALPVPGRGLPRPPLIVPHP